jgi:2-polyprenyl-3-methyl-5-hydroxy-6-metoxy-1,4-benzoquinol methylase
MKQPQLTVIQRAVLERAAALGLPAGARILDAPCGSGALAVALAELRFAAVGADLDTEAAAMLGPAFSRVDLNESLPWKEQTFDAVFSTEGIEHLENHFFFLREICRILKTGGILLLTTPNITALRSRVRFFRQRLFRARFAAAE